MKKIIGKLSIAFTVTFIIPQLVFLYVWEDLSTRVSSLLLISTILLTGVGCFLIWDIVQALRSVFKGISDITKEELKAESKDFDDEFQIMGDSIEIISKKIVEDMVSLQRSASVIEKTKNDLKETLLYTENVMNSMGDALIVIDSEYRIKRMNPAAKKLLDFHVDNYLKQTIDLFVDQSETIDFSKDTFVTGKRMTFISTKGEKMPVDVNIGPLVDPKGSHIGHVLVARDIRETLALIARLKKMNSALEGTIQQRTAVIKKAYDELKVRDAQILLQENMASIGVLASGIKHEIDYPLEYIRNNLERLQKDFKDILSYTQLMEYGLSALLEEDNMGNRAKEIDQFKKVRTEMKIEAHLSDFGTILKESRKGIERIREIIFDLNRFSYSDEDKLETVNLNDEIQGTLNIVRHELKGETKILKEFNPIPLVKCYPNLINQVFMSILINASQAVGSAGTITILTSSKEGLVSVMIQDTGPGIPSENLNKVFNPFFTTKPPGKGTGLGLYLSYDIIEKHKGVLSVKSSLGKGAQFTIELPAVNPEIPIQKEEGIPVA